MLSLPQVQFKQNVGVCSWSHNLSMDWIAFFKKWSPGSSLVVQWLSFHTFTVKGTGSIPRGETKSLQAVWHDQKKAPHSSTLAWKIPWTEEPGGLQSMGSLGVRHDWATSLWLFTFMHWSRKWQTTPVFLPGESHGQKSLVGCCLWSRTESGTTEAT